MVRCEEFYKWFEKKGNFCGKSEAVAKKVEEYIEYVKRNDIGTYKISNCALDPFMSIEFTRDGKVHRTALRELKSMIKRSKIAPDKITRRISIEIINNANNKVGEGYKIESIPGIRSRMRGNEHEVGDISYENREMFDSFKRDIGVKNNNDALRIMMEACYKDIEVARKIKEEIGGKEDIMVVKQA